MRTDILAFFLTFSFVLSGCLVERGEQEPTVRIGDRVWYESDTLSLSLHLVGVDSLNLPEREPCRSLVVVSEHGSTAGDTSLIESRMCMDPSFERRSISEVVHAATQETEYHMSTGGWGTAELIMVCSLRCKQLAEGKIVLEARHPPDQSTRVEFKKGDAKGVYAAFIQHRHDEVIELTNVTMKYEPESAYPVSVVRRSTWVGRDFENRWDYVLARHTPGKADPLQVGDSLSPLRAPNSFAPWGRIPVEGESPFYYPQEKALLQLDLVLDFQSYRDEHPSAFLAAASYHVFHDDEHDQSEYLWGFVWQDGAAGFTARCHLLETRPVGQQSPAKYVEESCFESGRTELEMQYRSDLPEQALSWESAVRLWRDAMGSDEPVEMAQWTTFDAEMMHGRLEDRARPTGEITIILNYRAGTFVTDPPQPSWIVLPPPGQHRSTVHSDTILDGATGRIWYLISPNPLTL